MRRRVEDTRGWVISIRMHIEGWRRHKRERWEAVRSRSTLGVRVWRWSLRRFSDRVLKKPNPWTSTNPKTRKRGRVKNGWWEAQRWTRDKRQWLGCKGVAWRKKTTKKGKKNKKEKQGKQGEREEEGKEIHPSSLIPPPELEKSTYKGGGKALLLERRKRVSLQKREILSGNI